MDRICITPENVDELVEKYAEEYWPAKDIASTFASMGVNMIVDWSRAGEVRYYSIPKGERQHRQPWNRYSVSDCIVARSRHRKLRPFQRRVVNGIPIFRCNRCEEWKGEDDFYKDRKREAQGNQALLPYCKRCHNKAGQQRRDENPEVKLKERVKFQRRYEALKERRIAAKRWKAPTRIETTRILALIDARFPLPDDVKRGSYDRLLSEQAGMNEDAIRAMRRNEMTKLSTVDALLTGLHMTVELAELNEEIEKDRPRWHPDHPYCRTCHRDDKTYMAKGLCSTCYRHRDDPDYRPVTGTKWSLRYACCIECRRTDRRHAARGLCGACWQRKRKAQQLEAVGSGHGNDRLVQQEAEAPDGEATDGGRSGRDDLGRVASHA